MATCSTTAWVSTAPQMKLTVEANSSNDTTVVLGWKLEYIASSPADSVARPYSVVINGTTVASGSFDIDGKKGTYTVTSGTFQVQKGTSKRQISFGVTVDWSLTWSGVYRGEMTASGVITIDAKTQYTVSYNANGGSDAPSSQTKWYGEPLTLSSQKPTRKNYTFQGWGVSASSTSVSYAAGASYKANSSITLYAIWTLSYRKPRITGLTITRCDQQKNPTEEGTYAKVSFGWACDDIVSSIDIKWKLSTASSYPAANTEPVEANGESGKVTEFLIGNGLLESDLAYTIQITVKDASDSSSPTRTLGGKIYPIDFLPGGKGTAIGKAAETENLFDVHWPAQFNGSVDIAKTENPQLWLRTVKGADTNSGRLIKNKVTNADYGTWLCDYVSSTDYVDLVLRASTDDDAGKIRIAIGDGSGNRYWYTILSTLICKDYIVERGTSGIWTYEKWNSGKSVCWGQATSGGTPNSATEGNLYFSSWIVPFPENLFIDTPTVVATVKGNWIGGVLSGNNLSKTQWHGYTWAATNNVASLIPHIQAVGKWK